MVSEPVSKDVVMESEDLWISSARVRVTYRFRNTGSEDVQTTAAFPVPGIPLCDECAGDLPISDGANPMNFKLKIDGEPKTYKTSPKRVRTRDYTEMRITHYWEQSFPQDRVVIIEHGLSRRRQAGPVPHAQPAHLPGALCAGVTGG
jgi:hypothetical protein